MIGEVLSAQGKTTEATAYFDRAAKLTLIGYGPADPRSRLAALSMTRQQARLGQASLALKTLDAMTALPGEGTEDAKLRWIARMSAAESVAGWDHGSAPAANWMRCCPNCASCGPMAAP